MRITSGARAGARPGGHNRGGGRNRYHARELHSQRADRAEIVSLLGSKNLLPAIFFIFSRNGCDQAVQQVLRAGVRLTEQHERDEIRAYVEEHCRTIPDQDLAVLGYWEWLDGLERGIAAHHAGMLPAFKEAVEECFVRGLVKAVFATETLALGINMPARSVVIEKLSKWNGETHADITPGEYTQLTGRVGRRGLDIEGHAVVLWQPGMNPRELAEWILSDRLPVRLQLQAHKYIWPPDTRGV